MKLNLDWKGMFKAIAKAAWPFIAGALGGLFTGCSGLAPRDKTQTMGVYAFGIPGIAVITQSHQAADNAGSDTNAAVQANPVTVQTATR